MSHKLIAFFILAFTESKPPDFGTKSGDFVVQKKTDLLHPQETPLANL